MPLEPLPLLRIWSDWCRFSIWLLAVTLNIGGLQDLSANSEVLEIDTRPAFTVNGTQVSRYLVNKYFGRYAEEWGARKGQPSREQVQAWFDLFIAKQVVIADASIRGYLQRPEVCDIVDRMERYMLTQAQGPLYKQLYSEADKYVGSIDEFDRRASPVYDVQIIHFADAATARHALGADFANVSFKDQTDRVANVRDFEVSERHDGLMRWPFFPCVEIASALESAVPARWILFEDPSFGVYAIHLRSVKNEARDSASVVDGPKGYNQRDRAGIAATLQSAHEALVQRQRYYTILRKCALAVEEVSAGKLVKFCQQLPPSASEIRCPAELGQLPLFHYFSAHPDGRSTVSIELFCRFFNAQFIRQIPQTLPAVRRSVQEMVVNQIDIEEARSRGIDTSAQFTEDRLGFARFQALDLYEKEILTPQVSVTAAQIAAYAREHPTEFQRVASVRVQRLKFRSMDAIKRWRIDGKFDDDDALQPKVDEFILDRNELLPGLEELHGILFQQAPGATFGPIVQGDCFVIVRRGENGSVEPIPLAEISETIRARLLRQALDQRCHGSLENQPLRVD